MPLRILKLIVIAVMGLVIAMPAWSKVQVVATDANNESLVVGGSIAFYSNASCTTATTTFDAGSTVYIKATPDVEHTVWGMSASDFSLTKAVNTNAASVRRRNIPFGDITVTLVNTDNPSIFKFTLPTDEDGIIVIVSATFPEKSKLGDEGHGHINYIDGDGNTVNTEGKVVYILDGTETMLGASGKETWYVCLSNITYTGTITLNGNVHLILADNSAMTVGTETSPIDDYAIYGENAGIAIYIQSTGNNMGSLTAIGGSAGIKANGVTINGGKVSATSDTGTGIYAYNDNGTANVTINGGQVTATGTEGIRAAGDITLGWANNNDYIYASSYDGTVKTAENKHFKAYTPAASATESDKPFAYIAGGHTFTETEQNAIASKVLKPHGAGLAYLDWDDTEKELVEKNTDDNNNANDFVYILQGGAGEVHGANIYTTLSGGWYVAEGEVAYTCQLRFTGDAHIILADNCKMTVGTEANPINSTAIYNSEGITIYGQSTGNNLGLFEVYVSENNCIAAESDITINGGQVNLIANGTSSAGIKANGITINSGKVTATGDTYGIYAYSNSGTADVTINGGSVTATATGTNSEGIRASGDITLGWTNNTDFIKASSYNAVNGYVKTAEDKHMKAFIPAASATDTEKAFAYISGGHKLNATELTALAGKVLKPNADGLTYLDWDDTKKALVSKNTCTDDNTANDYVYVLQGNETTLGATGAKNWYICNTPATENDGKGLTYNGELTFQGIVHFILADNSAITVTNTSGNAVETSMGNLAIYAQSTGSNMGSFSATSTGYGIYANDGSITINSGKINVKSTGNFGIYVPSGDITINGGTVTANSTNHFAISVKQVTINGGQVTATGGMHGNGGYYSSGTPTITLSWTNPTDFIKVSSYNSEYGAVKIPAGKTFAYTDDGGTTTVLGNADTDYIFGSGSNATLDDIAGKTLHPIDIINTGGVTYLGMCRYDGDWRLSAGVKAYVVTGYDITTGTVTLSEAPLDGLPKGVPVILIKDTDSDGVPDGNLDPTFNLISTTDTEGADIEGSVPTTISPLFTAGDGTKTMEEMIIAATGSDDTSGYMAFILENGVFKMVTFSDTSVPAAGTCFLLVSKFDVLLMVRNSVTPPTSNARAIAFDLGGDATGIEEVLGCFSTKARRQGAEKEVKEGGKEDVWYDLNGRKVTKPTMKGIYINGNRKVVIK